MTSKSEVIKWLDELPQTTGIISRNARWAKNAQAELRSLIPEEMIQSSDCYDGIIGIRLKSNKSIRFVLPYEMYEYIRFHRIYIDVDVPESKYKDILLATVTGCPYVIQDVPHMIRGGVSFNDYYVAKWIVGSDGYRPFCSECGEKLLIAETEFAQKANLVSYPSVCPSCGRSMK